MSYSRRQLYALGEPLGESVTRKEGGRIIYGSGGGPGGNQTSTGTTYNTNIPEYARPYVETMLGAAQKQIFNVNPDTGKAESFKPYTPYSTDVNKYFAGPTPMQEQAYKTAANMEVPEQYATATGLAGTSAMGSLGLAGRMAGTGADYARMATDPTATKAYMSPYMQNVVDYQKSQALRDYGIGRGMRGAAAVGQGAFGGSRQAIAEAEAERNLMSQIGGIEATGAQKAFEQAQQAQQYGATLGLQGQQGALQGLGQTLQGATTLGQLGTSQLGAQTNIANLQSTYGAQQQALEQQKINQAIQNYATAQQYPYMQLGILNSLLRGLPMQATTVESYQATPSIGQQAAGLGLSGLGAYKTLSSFKEGGEVKGYANRGLAVASGVENSIRAKLEAMTPQQLEQVAKTSQSPEIRAMAEEVLAAHTQRDRAEDQARQAIAQEQAAKPQMPQSMGLAAAPTPNMDTVGAAGGGIVAFAGRDESLVQDEEEGYNPFANIQDKKLREVALGQEQLRRSFGYKDGVYDQYKQFLAEKQAGLGKEREGAVGAWLMDLGSRVSSTAGPAGQVMGQSIQGSLPTLQKGLVDYKKGQADLYKAQADVAKAENDVALGRADKTQAAYDALRKEENDFKRTQMQVEGQVRAAGISANRETDLRFNYNKALNQITGGRPETATPEQQAKAAAQANEWSKGLPQARLDADIFNKARKAVDDNEEIKGLRIKQQQYEPGDTQWDKLQEQINAKTNEILAGKPAAPVTPPPVGAVTVDGYVFPSQEQADAYKREKAKQKPA